MLYPPINISDAKTRLSRLIDALSSGQSDEIIILRNGKPAARLVPIRPLGKGPRIGIAAGEYVIPDPDPADDEMIAALFNAQPRRSMRKPKR